MFPKKENPAQSKTSTNRCNRSLLHSFVLVLLLIALLITSGGISPLYNNQSLLSGDGTAVFPQQVKVMGTLGDRVEKEVGIGWGVGWNLDTPFFLKGSIIQVCFTLLPCSNSSVFFEYFYNDDPHDHWLPRPTDFTLAPGESSGPTNYTLERAMVENAAALIYSCYVLTEGSNATVRWWYEVIKEGPLPFPLSKFLSWVIPAILVLGTLIPVIVVWTQRKKAKKWFE